MLKQYNLFYIFIVLIIICFIVYLFNIYRDTEEKFTEILRMTEGPFASTIPTTQPTFYLSYITDAYIEGLTAVTDLPLTEKNSFKPTLRINQSLDDVIATFPINDNSIFVMNNSFQVFKIETISPIKTISPIETYVEPTVNLDVDLKILPVTTTSPRYLTSPNEKILKIIYNEVDKLYILTNLGNIVIIPLINFINGTVYIRLTVVSAVDIFLFGPNNVGFLNNNGEIKFYEIPALIPEPTTLLLITTYDPIISPEPDKIIKVACNNNTDKKIVVYIDTVKTDTVTYGLKYIIFESGTNSGIKQLTPPSYNIESPGKCRLLLSDYIFVLIDSIGNLFTYRLNFGNDSFEPLTITGINNNTTTFLDAIFVKETTEDTGPTEYTVGINYLITKVENTTYNKHELRIFKFDELSVSEKETHVSTITGIKPGTFFCGSHINRLFILDSTEIESNCQKCSLTEHDSETNDCTCVGFGNLTKGYTEEDIENIAMCQEISNCIIYLASDYIKDVMALSS